MHIAFFSTSLPEPGRKPGGVDVHVKRLADRLAARGHRIDVYSYSPPSGESRYRHVQLRPQGLRHRPLARMTVVPILLNRLLVDADVLHLHGDDGLFVRRRLPTVRTFYGSGLWEARTATGLQRRLACGVSFISEIVASRLATATYDIAPGTGSAFSTQGTLPPAIDIAPVACPQALRPTVLFVGTWTGRKRGRFLAEVFARDVLPALPDARLVMVSDHVEPAAGIEHWPHPSDGQLTALMQEAWIMCLPSTYEGFGIPYIEAMAAGAVVVATPNVGARYVLDNGRAGVLCSDEDLGQALLRTLLDGELRAGFAERGRGRVRAFAWEHVLDLHEHAYADALRRFKRPGDQRD